MNSETIIYCIFAVILGMLVFHMLKNICGCNVVEGNTDDDNNSFGCCVVNNAGNNENNKNNENNENTCQECLPDKCILGKQSCPADIEYYGPVGNDGKSVGCSSDCGSGFCDASNCDDILNPKCKDNLKSKDETELRVMYTEACVHCNEFVDKNMFMYDPNSNIKCRELTNENVNTVICSPEGVVVNKNDKWNASYGYGAAGEIKACMPPPPPLQLTKEDVVDACNLVDHNLKNCSWTEGENVCYSPELGECITPQEGECVNIDKYLCKPDNFPSESVRQCGGNCTDSTGCSPGCKCNAHFGKGECIPVENCVLPTGGRVEEACSGEGANNLKNRYYSITTKKYSTDSECPQKNNIIAGREKWIRFYPAYCQKDN